MNKFYNKYLNYGLPSIHKDISNTIVPSTDISNNVVRDGCKICKYIIISHKINCCHHLCEYCLSKIEIYNDKHCIFCENIINFDDIILLNSKK